MNCQELELLIFFSKGHEWKTLKTLCPSRLLRQRHFFINYLHVRILHWQMPILKVVVKVKSLVQHNLLVGLQQAEGEVYE